MFLLLGVSKVPGQVWVRWWEANVEEKVAMFRDRRLPSLVSHHLGASIAIVEVGTEPDHAVGTGIVGGDSR